MAQLAYREAAGEWEAIQPHRALEATWTVCSAANQYVDRAAPWTEAKKGNQARVDAILATLLEVLRAVMRRDGVPAMPTKCDELRAQLGLPKLAPKIGEDIWPARLAPRRGGRAARPRRRRSFRPPTTTARRSCWPGSCRSGTPSRASHPRRSRDSARRGVDQREGEAPEPPGEPEGHGAAAELPRDAAAPLVRAVRPRRPPRRPRALVRKRVPKKEKLLDLRVDLGECRSRGASWRASRSRSSPRTSSASAWSSSRTSPPRDFGRGLVSHGMLLASGPSDALILATVDGDAAPGAKLK